MLGRVCRRTARNLGALQQRFGGTHVLGGNGRFGAGRMTQTVVIADALGNQEAEHQRRFVTADQETWSDMELYRIVSIGLRGCLCVERTVVRTTASVVTPVAGADQAGGENQRLQQHQHEQIGQVQAENLPNNDVIV